VKEAWAHVAADERRTLIYGPRIGRLYLVLANEADDRRFQRVIGLTGARRLAALEDPADRIVHDLTTVENGAAALPTSGLCSAYLLMLASRSVVPLRFAARLVRDAARLTRARGTWAGAKPSDIGRVVHMVERHVGKSDCYPRALLTVFLSLSAARPCTLAVGVLAPTRKMHAWCAIDGDLPYEPLPEHYLYQPLWTIALCP
jgi:hypothetical protein